MIKIEMELSFTAYIAYLQAKYWYFSQMKILLR